MAANFWLSTHCNLWTTVLTPGALAASRRGYEGLTEDNVCAIQASFIDGGLPTVICWLGTRLKFRRKVIATATVYFKRFYVKRRFTEVNPWLASATVLYLASKIEESTARVQDILNELKKKHGEVAGVDAFTDRLVLECELVVLETLHFDLIVFHPYRPLQQYLLDVNLGSDVLQSAWSIVNDSYRLDVCLLCPPYVIALAAVYLACAYMGRDITDWFEKLNVNRKEVNDVVQQLLAMYKAATAKDDTSVDDLVAVLEPMCPRPAVEAAAGAGAASAMPPPPLA